MSAKSYTAIAIERIREDERAKVVEFIRDVAKRLSVQTGERAVAGTDTAYLLAKAIEDGNHHLTDDEEPTPKRSTDGCPE